MVGRRVPRRGRDLNRWVPLVKSFLAIPRHVVLFFISIAVIAVVIFSWFAVVFTGRYPRGASGSWKA